VPTYCLQRKCAIKEESDYMAYYSISPRDGKYCCQVRWYPEEGAKRKSKNKTFNTKAAAKTWGKAKVAEIEAQIATGHEFLNFDNSINTLGQLIRKYLEDEHVVMGRSKRFSLEAISDCDIATTEPQKLKSKHIVDYCKDRRAAGASPATVACDVSHLRAVLKSARALYDINVNERAIVDAMSTLHTLGLVGKGNIRTRRPNDIEVERIIERLAEMEQQDNTVIPYVDIFNFSLLSCMRIGEVCTIMWEDLNEEESWIWVRDRKDPRKKIGNHMKVPLLGGALEIVMRQPRKNSPHIFPFKSRSVTAGYRRARKSLNISDLRYHDLRREGASRLFEQGFSLDQVAQVTGHKDLNTLWRIYTDLRPDRLKS